MILPVKYIAFGHKPQTYLGLGFIAMRRGTDAAGAGQTTDITGRLHCEPRFAGRVFVEPRFTGSTKVGQ